MSWVGIWLGVTPAAVSTPTPPSVPVTSTASTDSTDPDVITHLDEALDRLCEQFKGD